MFEQAVEEVQLKVGLPGVRKLSWVRWSLDRGIVDEQSVQIALVGDASSNACHGASFSMDA